MKRVLFVLTIILSLISCTTEVTKIINDEPKKVVHYKVNYNSSYEGTPDSFVCESGYVLTEEDLPVINREYHSFIGWYDEKGIKISKGYKVLYDIILEPKFEWDTQHYRYFFRTGDFYIDDKGYKCSKPNGKLISSTVNPFEIKAYIGGQLTFLLCDYFFSSRNFEYKNNDIFISSENGINVDRRDKFCGFKSLSKKENSFNQFSIINEHALYTNLSDIDFSHTYSIFHLGGFIKHTCNPCDYTWDEISFLALYDKTEDSYSIIYINNDGCLYKKDNLTYEMDDVFRSSVLYQEVFEEWSGDWSKKDNNNAPKIKTVKLNEIIFGVTSQNLLSYYDSSNNQLLGAYRILPYYSDENYNYPDAPYNDQKFFNELEFMNMEQTNNDVYLELWHFD